MVKSANFDPPTSPKEAEIASLMSLEMKVDKILKYQKAVKHLAIFRAIISFIFFFVFIVLPIIGSWYLFKFVQENVDIEQISGQYKDFYSTMEQVKDAAGQVGEIGNIMDKLPVIGQ